MGGMAEHIPPPMMIAVQDGGASSQQRLEGIANDDRMHPEARSMAADFTQHLNVAGSTPVDAATSQPNPEEMLQEMMAGMPGGLSMTGAIADMPSVPRAQEPVATPAAPPSAAVDGMDRYCHHPRPHTTGNVSNLTYPHDIIHHVCCVQRSFLFRLKT